VTFDKREHLPHGQRWTIDGDKIVMDPPLLGDRQRPEATYTFAVQDAVVDPRSNPRPINLTLTVASAPPGGEPREGKLTLRGVALLERDRLTLCLALRGGRPTGRPAGEGGQSAVLVLEREKPSDTRPEN
jgi:uncharacterized protein (TIGR03067 family)